jgi:transcriptional regulator with XRE-family HTH domain
MPDDDPAIDDPAIDDPAFDAATDPYEVMAAVLAEPAQYDAASRAEIVLDGPQSLGLALRRARRQAGLCQRGLARRGGVASTTVARIETGAADPTVGTLVRLLAAADLELAVTGLEPSTFVFGIVENQRDARGRRPPVHRLSEAGTGYWDRSVGAAVRRAIDVHLADLRLLNAVAGLRAQRR